MGNLKSRNRVIVPDIKATRNPVRSNTIEIKSKESCPTCPTCKQTGREFSVASRDGTTFIKMYYCRSCSNHWKG